MPTRSATRRSSTRTPRPRSTWIRVCRLTLFFKDTASTRDVNKAQIYAWRKGIKTLYYIRLRQMALEGTQVENCVCCML